MHGGNTSELFSTHCIHLPPTGLSKQRGYPELLQKAKHGSSKGCVLASEELGAQVWAALPVKLLVNSLHKLVIGAYHIHERGPELLLPLPAQPAVCHLEAGHCQLNKVPKCHPQSILQFFKWPLYFQKLLATGQQVLGG